MRIAGLPLVIKFLASASCLAWISAISFSLIWLLHLSSYTGWAIAGVLSFAAGIPIVWFRLQMGQALDIADYPDSKIQTEAATEEDFHVPAEPPGDICIF